VKSFVAINASSFRCADVSRRILQVIELCSLDPTRIPMYDSRAGGHISDERIIWRILRLQIRSPEARRAFAAFLAMIWVCSSVPAFCWYVVMPVARKCVAAGGIGEGRSFGATLVAAGRCGSCRKRGRWPRYALMFSWDDGNAFAASTRMNENVPFALINCSFNVACIADNRSWRGTLSSNARGNWSMQLMAYDYCSPAGG
jgi:hypothetical protein